MITLKCPGFEQELFWDENNHACELIIENQKYFRKIIKEFYFHPNDNYTVSLTSNGKALKFNDDVDLIINPIKLDFGNRKAMTNLLKILVKTSLSENYYLETNKLKTKIVQYLNTLIDSEDFYFEVTTEDFSLDQIAKAINFHVVDNEEDFVELLTNYLEMMSELAKTKLFIFIALRSFITNEEINRFCKNISNHQINVLFIEDQTRDKIPEISRMTIDADLCNF